MKKIILTLGSVVAIGTPVIAVVSCGKDQLPTSQELKDRQLLNSDKAQRLLENEWQFKVLDWKKNTELNKSFKDVTSVPLKTSIKATAQAMIQNHLNKESNYLMKIVAPLITVQDKRIFDDSKSKKMEVYTQEWLTNNGLWKDFTYGDATFGASGITDDAIKLLISDDRLSFKTDLLKSLVVQKYLKNVHKNMWSIAYPDEAQRLTSLQLQIDSNQFILVKEMMEKKYFAKWEVELNDVKSNLAMQKKSFDDSIKAMSIDIKGGTEGLFYKNASFTEKKKKLPTTLFDFSFSAANTAKDNMDNMAGFKGIESLPSGPGLLKFDNDAYTEDPYTPASSTGVKGITADDVNKWYGFISNADEASNDKFIYAGGDPDDKVNWRKQGAKAKLTFVKGLMPVYHKADPNKSDDKNKIWIDGGTTTQIDHLSRFFSVNDISLYTQAMDYYRTEIVGRSKASENKKPIILDIPNKDIKKIYVDELNLKFVQKRELKK